MRKSIRIATAAAAIVTAGLVGPGVAAAVGSGTAPAAVTVAAASGCTDRTTVAGTPVHASPWDSSGVMKTLPDNYAVRGTCDYYDDWRSGANGHWYMQVAVAYGGYGYIWVQRLQHGAAHHCNHAGHLLAIGPEPCPLHSEA